MPSLSLGLSTTRGTSPAPSFTLADFEDRFLHFRASDGPLNPSGLPAVDADAVDQWLDLSGEGNHLTAFDATRRFEYDADGGPIGQPVCKSPADLLRRASLTGGAQVGFTMIVLGRWNTAGYGSADLPIAGDGSPACDWRSLSAEVTGTPPSATINSRMTASSGNSANISTPMGVWMLFVVECTDGVVPKGRWAFDDAVPTLMSGSPSEFELNAIALGANYGNTSHANFDFLEVCFLRRPAISQDDWNLVRNYAAKQLGKTFSDTTEFLDTFQRADTSTNNIGLSNTNCGWELSGGDLNGINARLLNNGLTIVEGDEVDPDDQWGTFYAEPLITFNPSIFEWDYSMRAGGGGSGFDCTNACGLSANLDNINDMVHMVWGKTQIRIERFNPAGVGTIIVGTVAFGTPFTAGTIRVQFDFSAGLIHVTDPNGTVTTLDWDAVALRPLVDFNTRKTFVEIIAGADDELITTYNRVYLRSSP